MALPPDFYRVQWKRHVDNEARRLASQSKQMTSNQLPQADPDSSKPHCLHQQPKQHDKQSRQRSMTNDSDASYASRGSHQNENTGHGVDDQRNKQSISVARPNSTTQVKWQPEAVLPNRQEVMYSQFSPKLSSPPPHLLVGASGLGTYYGAGAYWGTDVTTKSRNINGGSGGGAGVILDDPSPGGISGSSVQATGKQPAPYLDALKGTESQSITVNKPTPGTNPGTNPGTGSSGTIKFFNNGSPTSPDLAKSSTADGTGAGARSRGVHDDPTYAPDWSFVTEMWMKARVKQMGKLDLFAFCFGHRDSRCSVFKPQQSVGFIVH